MDNEEYNLDIINSNSNTGKSIERQEDGTYNFPSLNCNISNPCDARTPLYYINWGKSKDNLGDVLSYGSLTSEFDSNEEENTGDELEDRYLMAIKCGYESIIKNYKKFTKIKLKAITDNYLQTGIKYICDKYDTAFNANIGYIFSIGMGNIIRLALKPGSEKDFAYIVKENLDINYFNTIVPSMLQEWMPVNQFGIEGLRKSADYSIFPLVPIKITNEVAFCYDRIINESLYHYNIIDLNKFHDQSKGNIDYNIMLQVCFSNLVSQKKLDIDRIYEMTSINILSKQAEVRRFANYFHNYYEKFNFINEDTSNTIDYKNQW